MGTWGPGPFDNDDAAEWSDYLLSRKSRQPIKTALQAVIKRKNPEADVCFPALAAAALVSATAQRTVGRLPEDLAEWVAECSFHPTREEVELAGLTVSKICEKSELVELAADYADWQKVTKNLLTRLKQQARSDVAVGPPKKQAARKQLSIRANRSEPDRGEGEMEQLLRKLAKSGIVETSGTGKVIRIKDHGLLTDKLLRELLPHAPALKILEIYNAKVTDRGLATIATVSGLEVLELDQTKKITNSGLAHLKSLTALRELSLFYDPLISDEGVKHLKELPNLEAGVVRHQHHK